MTSTRTVLELIEQYVPSVNDPVNLDLKVTNFEHQIFRKRCLITTAGQTNKSYIIYRSAPFSMTLTTPNPIGYAKFDAK